MKRCVKFGPTVALLTLQAALSWPASAQTPLDPAAANALVGMRPMILMMRDTLESTARQMGAADPPQDIEAMLDQMETGTGSTGRVKPAPVDPTIRTLDCAALTARVKQVDTAIEAKFVAVDVREKEVDAQIKTSSSAAGAVMASTSQLCNYGGLVGCLAGLLTSRTASAAMDVAAASNVAAVNEVDKLRAGFDPLLRERTTAIYYSARKECK